MKIQIPEDLKKDVPEGFWGKVLSATPIVMAVVATALAGLASSEMTRAQYDRSLAAQRQAKAGDQWALFQAKRLRGALQRSTLDLLHASAAIRPLDPARLLAEANAARTAAGEKPFENGAADALKETIARLQSGEMPPLPRAAPWPPPLEAAVRAVDGVAADAALAPLLKRVKDPALEAALAEAQTRAQTMDAAFAPTLAGIERTEAALARAAPDRGGARRALLLDFMAARLRFMALRYDAEAKLNREIAQLYEVQVRKGNLSATRHHLRSQRFFFGMLAAQAAVIVATFAIAARKRSLLWSLATAAGVAAISFALYVYVFV